MPTQQPRLLITDDDQAFRQSLAEAMVRRGFDTLQASDGQEALEILGQQPVHLLMLDVHMPRLSGLATLERLNLQAEVKPLPCILMSAKLDENIMREAQRWSSVSLLSKPFSLGLATSTLSNLLRQVYGWEI